MDSWRDMLLVNEAYLCAALMMKLGKGFSPRQHLLACGPQDASSLTASSDNLLPAVLHRLGVIEVSASISEEISSLKDVSNAPWVLALRAAAVVAVERMLQACGGVVTARQLDSFLRSKPAGDPAPPGHLVKSTVFY
mmetsp:Transcript_30388/g.85858  ORF Transcript_30388/g.85858 Transcript_30388/m.85858 type:complete len:137 (-) Transcript_30388:692-1102(-)